VARTGVGDLGDFLAMRSGIVFEQTLVKQGVCEKRMRKSKIKMGYLADILIGYF
jgi:hypothetical protein